MTDKEQLREALQYLKNNMWCIKHRDTLTDEDMTQSTKVTIAIYEAANSYLKLLDEIDGMYQYPETGSVAPTYNDLLRAGNNQALDKVKEIIND